MQKMSGESMDIVTKNVEKIKELFPEAFCEDKIDFERLQEVLGEYIEDKEERYRFEWSGKSKALRIAQTPSTGTLRPCKEESKNWDETENLYIEGDNLEVLKLLQKTYQSSIKMIYIDPPYNTGKDFVYPDNYRDNMKNYMEITGQLNDQGGKLSTNSETSGRYHTDWLNMMYPRLRLARNLLTDDGVIFISIDDNEVNNLKKICDELFGESNFIAQMAVQLNPRGRNLDRHIAKTHEFVLVYAKKYDVESTMHGVPKEGKMIEEYNKSDEVGKYRAIGLRNRNQSFNPTTRPNLYYPIYVNPINKKVSIVRDDKYTDEVWPDTPDGVKTCWTWGKSKVDSENEMLVAEMSGFEWRIFRKDYLLDKNGNAATTLIKSFWYDKEINNDYGKKAIKSLFGKAVMDFPKSPDLVKKLIVASTKNDDIILDFFSGSATTAHAVIESNLNDNSNRHFIMVQLPELIDEKNLAFKSGLINICEIGKERIRRAGDKIVSELEEKRNGQQSMTDEPSVNPDNLDIGFKVFKLDTSNLKKWNPDYDNLENTLDNMINNYVEGRTEEDVLYEIMLKFGIDLTYPIETESVNGSKVFIIGAGSLFICLDDDIKKEVADFIASRKKDLNPEVTRVVFKDNGFKNDSVKTNILQILKRNGIDEIMSV